MRARPWSGLQQSSRASGFIHDVYLIRQNMPLSPVSSGQQDSTTMPFPQPVFSLDQENRSEPLFAHDYFHCNRLHDESCSPDLPALAATTPAALSGCRSLHVGDSPDPFEYL